jgi:hypothetical protein
MGENTLAFLVRMADVLKTPYEWAFQFRTAIDWQRWDKCTCTPSDKHCGLETFVLQYRKYQRVEYVK